MRKKTQETIVFDIGSSKIAAIVGAINDSGSIEIKNCSSYPIEGIRSSLITDATQAEASIFNAIFSVENASKNFIIKEVSVSICTSKARSSYVNARIKIPSGSVTKQDLQKLINKALSDFSESLGQIIHYFPTEFILDNNRGIVNPIGLLGKELSCNLHIVSVDSNVLSNLMNCLSKCQLKVKEVVLSSYASALGVLPQDEGPTASLVIDFGARSTSFVITLEGRMLHFGCLAIGSWYITSDIAKAFSISIASAEKLKVMYGSSKLTRNSQLVNLHDLDSTEFAPNQVISTADLSEIISSRVKEIFTLLKQEYDKLKIGELMAQNIILTGDGSSLNDLAETVADIFGKNVKVGELSAANLDSSYACGLGMLRFIAQKQKEKLDLLNVSSSKGIFNKVFEWIRQNI